MKELKEILFEQRRQSAASPPLPLDEMRARTDAAFASMPPVDGATNRPAGAEEAGGAPAEWTLLDGVAPRGTILYFHGGAYRQGSIASHRRLLANLCVPTGMRGLNIGYRLAPEHPFPAALDDALVAYRWLTSAGGSEPNQVVIAGDSAGGGLALATLVALRDAGDPLPAGGFAMSPWTDLAGTSESLTSRADIDPVVVVASIMDAATRYVGDADPRDPLVSPLYADLSGLPPLLLHVGEAEVIYDDSTRFAEKARQSGVDMELEVWPEAFHVHHQMAGQLPEADEAISHAAAWIVKRME
jgi:epsilon-lactone hydrolase